MASSYSSAIPIMKPNLDLSPPLDSKTTSLTPTAITFSVASALTAAVFIPNLGASPKVTEQTLNFRVEDNVVSGGMEVGAQEFIPRRVETPALSEDSPFYSPNPLTNHALTNMNEDLRNGGRGGDLVDYYNRAMDLEHNAEYARRDVHPGPSHERENGGEQPMYDYPSGGTGDAYYQQQGASQFVRQPLQYHLYHPSPGHTSVPPTQSFFLPSSLHIALTDKSEATLAAPTSEVHLPEEVGGYNGLIPLDKGGLQNSGGGAEGSSWGGYRSWVYKAWKADGRAYILRRIEGYRLQHEAAITVIEKWTRVRHPGLISVREAFTTRAFGDHSIIFVYDFHPCSTTLYEAHLSPLSSLPPNPWGSIPNSHNPHPINSHSQFRGGGGGIRNPLPLAGSGGSLNERLLWSYIVQLGGAIKVVHNAGLAVRNLEPNRILITGVNRVRIGGCGALDVLVWDGSISSSNYQQEDLLNFGKLIITLACGSTTSVHNLPKSVDHISRVYSPDLKNVVLYLLSKPGPRKTIEEVLALMGGRVLDELNASLVAEDSLETALMKELENGRLVRLLTKFGFINERPEFDHDPRWAETGDRYIVKLFRDFVFHQVDESGRPVTDLSHVLSCLNKLDSGVEEKIMLVSRDEQSCLIVSYREVQNCINSAFGDLSR